MNTTERIKLFDLQFQGVDRTVAAFLLESNEGPVLVETGPHSTYPQLEALIRQAGYAPADIRHVLVTHIHLDHAGAAWVFAQQGATIYVHPSGAPHMRNPEKLYNSAKQIYQDNMEALWGDLRPIAEDKLKTVAHQEKIRIGDLEFTAWHTPGHAVHHIAWQYDGELFTGDVAGVRINDGMVAAPCPPPDINLEDWKNSIALIRELHPERLWLTHFGPVGDIQLHLDELEFRLEKWANWMWKPFSNGISPVDITPEFQEFAAMELIEAGTDEYNMERYELANPAWMSVAGLMRYWKKKTGV